MDEKLIERLRKLKNHADSASSIGSESEAQAFAAKLHSLLEEHNLEMSDVEWEEKRRQVAPQTWSPRAGSVSGWVYNLCCIISTVNHCRGLVTKDGREFIFVGLAESVEACIQMTDYLWSAATKLSEEAYAKRLETRGQTIWLTEDVERYKISWLAGFINRLPEKLSCKVPQDEHPKSGLVLQSRSIVRISQSIAAADPYIDSLGILPTIPMVKQVAGDISAYMDGAGAAGKVAKAGDSAKQIGNA